MYAYRHPTLTQSIFTELKAEKGAKKHLDVIRRHHRDTYEHSLRVSKLSIDLAIENDLPCTAVMTIGRAALLHDYGKSHVSKDILSKRGPLSPKEIDIMREHPRLGIKKLEKFLSRDAKKIILSHHKSTQDDLTQIVTAADMYDALTSSRSYKDGFARQKVRDLMHEQFTGKPHLIHQLIRRTPK